MIKQLHTQTITTIFVTLTNFINKCAPLLSRRRWCFKYATILAAMLYLSYPLRIKASEKRNRGPPYTAKPQDGTDMPSLPNEVVDVIVAHLDPPSAACLALTCRRMYHCVLTVSKSSTLDDVCPKSYYKQSARSLQLYYVDQKLPHYRNPLKVLEYARDFGISRSTFNPAYTQLLLSLRGWMAPSYVFCFANKTPRYVPKKGGHVCSACQSERRYLAQDDLHHYTGALVRYDIRDWRRRW
jgi:hypothetical protein